MQRNGNRLKQGIIIGAIGLLSLGPIVGCGQVNSGSTNATAAANAQTSQTPDEPGRIYLAERQLSFIPPDGFVPLSGEDIRAEYPGDAPPNYVFTNRDRTARIAISFTPQPVSVNQLLELQKAMTKQMEKTMPGIKWIQRDQIAINGGSWVKMEAITKKQKDNLHNDMYFTSFQDRLLGISFSAKPEGYGALKQNFTTSRNSIQIAPESM
jgi:hypothetical protein